MSDKTVSVGLRIDGDSKGAQAAIDATDKGLQKLPEASQKAKTSADRLNESFGKLGIRSARQIEADILDVNQALLKLAQRANVSGDEFDRAFAAGQKRIEALKAELKSVPDEMGKVGQKADNMLALFGRLGLAFSGVELARQFVMVNVELENVERSFKAVTGSVEKATAEMDYARGVASRLGLEQISTAKAYASLMAATKGTSVEGEASRQVFESVARSMSLAGKSAADTEGALLALQQMASKGVISMEELRGQLGERLPGALNAAAEGLGITTAQLIKLTETGQLTAEELFPALAAGLNKLYSDGGAETLTQEWNHFKNAVQDVYEAIGDSGVVDGLKISLETMETTIVTTSTMLVALGKDIGTFFGALANGDIGINGFSENAKRAFAEIEDEARARLVKVAQHNGVMAASLDDLGKAALASAKQQSTASTQSASDWTKLNVAFGTVKESGDAATKQAEKNADATKAEGEAAMELANSLGAETDKQLARVDASRKNAAALAEVAERRREELAMATEHIAALEREVVANGGATEQQQKVIDALKKTAEARQADADKAIAQAAQSQVVAVQAQVESAAYEQANGALSRWSEAKQAQVSVDQAVIRLAIEQQRTIYEVARARGDEYGATQALLEIKRLEIKLAELTAQAKRAEAEASLLIVKAKREELMASGQLTAAKEAELKAQEAGAKVKQVEAQIASETAKRMTELADAYAQSGASASGASGHIGAIGNAAQSSVSGVDALTNSLNQLNSAQVQSGGGAGGMNGAERSQRESELGITSKMDSSSILDDKDVRNRKGKLNFTDVMYQRGASLAEAEAAGKYIGELYARNQATMLTGNLGNSENAARLNNQAINDAVDKALAAARSELSTGQQVDLGDHVGDIIARNMATMNRSTHVTPDGGLQQQVAAVKRAGTEANNQKTIRLELGSGNSKSTVFANTEGDADAFIRTLEAAGMRAKR